MRKIYNLLVVIALVVSFSSCEKDNYDAPEAGVYGQIVDHNGKIFQTAIGQGSMKIQITELSYAGGDESVVELSVHSPVIHSVTILCHTDNRG